MRAQTDLSGIDSLRTPLNVHFIDEQSTTVSPAIPARTLSLNPRTDLTIDLAVPLIVGESSHQIAKRILQDLYDRTNPVQWSQFGEAFVALFAIMASMASASTSKYFSDQIVSGFTHLNTRDETILSWCVATPAISAQFLFALNSNLVLNIKIKRYLDKASAEEFKAKLPTIIKTLAFVLPSVAATIVMGKKAFDFIPAAFMWSICGFRALAALGANADYFLQRRKDLKGLKKIPPISLVLDTQNYLNHLAAQNGRAFLELLASKNLLNLMFEKTHDTPQEDLESIFNQFLDFLPAPSNLAPRASKSKLLYYASLSIGATASLMNVMASMKVGSLWGWPVVTSLLEIFNDFSPLKLLSLFLGLVVCGVPAFYINTAINSISCARLFHAFGSIHHNIHDAGFKQYLKSFSAVDWVKVMFGLTIFSLAYGISNGGLTYLYPFLDVLKIPMCLNAIIVFTAIGFMSFDGSGNNLKNFYYKNLVTDLVHADNQIDHIAHLSHHPKQLNHTVTLTHARLNVKFDVLLDDLNSLPQEDLDTLFSSPFKAKLLQRYIQTPAPAQDASPAALVTRQGLFASPQIGAKPNLAPTIPKVISTNRLNAPPHMRQAITMFKPLDDDSVSTPVNTQIEPLSPKTITMLNSI